jgi:hypothetical protein
VDVNVRKGFEMSTREEAEIKAIHDGVYHAWRNWLNENKQAIIDAIAAGSPHPPASAWPATPKRSIQEVVIQ